MTEHDCGCITYESGPPVCCAQHPNGPTLAFRGVTCTHVWVKSTTVFEDAPAITRLTEHCRTCPAWRGRV